MDCQLYVIVFGFAVSSVLIDFPSWMKLFILRLCGRGWPSPVSSGPPFPRQSHAIAIFVFRTLGRQWRESAHGTSHGTRSNGPLSTGITWDNWLVAGVHSSFYEMQKSESVKVLHCSPAQGT